MTKDTSFTIEKTADMLRCALGSEPTLKQYQALLRLLYEHMSDRNLAESVATAFGVAPERVLNDIYRVANQGSIAHGDLEAVMDRLEQCGFAEWLEEA